MKNKSNVSNLLILIDREYLEKDLILIQSGLLDENGKLDDVIFEELAREIFESLPQYLNECYSKIEHNRAMENRNSDAEKSSICYRLYRKNGWGYSNEFDLEGTFTNLLDARDTAKNYLTKEILHLENTEDRYKIVAVKDGIESKKDLYNPYSF